VDEKVRALLLLPDPIWRPNFAVALAWARRHYGERLRVETVDALRARLRVELDAPVPLVPLFLDPAPGAVLPRFTQPAAPDMGVAPADRRSPSRLPSPTFSLAFSSSPSSPPVCPPIPPPLPCPPSPLLRVWPPWRPPGAPHRWLAEPGSLPVASADEAQPRPPPGRPRLPPFPGLPEPTRRRMTRPLTRGTRPAPPPRLQTRLRPSLDPQDTPARVRNAESGACNRGNRF
jgi:hypothetical protein